jgi:hypothetical protein
MLRRTAQHAGAAVDLRARLDHRAVKSLGRSYTMKNLTSLKNLTSFGVGVVDRPPVIGMPAAVGASSQVKPGFVRDR